MAKMIFDGEGLLEEPCLSCDKAYVEDIWHDWCCDEKECPYNVKSSDVLDKIRDEIVEYKDDKIIHAERNEMIEIVLEIIDKYKAESDPQESEV